MNTLLAALVALQTAVAEPTQVEIYFMPPGTVLVLPTGEKVRYFTFEEYKLLLKMDGDLLELGQRLEIFQDLSGKYDAIVDQKDVVIRTLLDDKQVLNGRADRLDEKWQTCEAALTKAQEDRPVWPFVVGGVGVLVGVVGGALFASSWLLSR